MALPQTLHHVRMSSVSQYNQQLCRKSGQCTPGFEACFLVLQLTLNFLVAVVNTLNTKTHSSKVIAEFCFKNADVKCICYCKQRIKSKLSLSSEFVESKLCKPCTSFTWHLHNSCGTVWYRTSRVKERYGLRGWRWPDPLPHEIRQKLGNRMVWIQHIQCCALL